MKIRVNRLAVETSSRAVLILSVAAAFPACGSSNASRRVERDDAGADTGGSRSSGGASGTGGARANGGTAGTGGSKASGGTAGTGGSTGAGGEPREAGAQDASLDGS